MTGSDGRESFNHPHWDHSSLPPPLPARDPIGVQLSPLLRKAHLPGHPAASLALIAVGLGHLLLVSRPLADLIDWASGGSRAFLVAATTFFVVLALPGLALVLIGARDLARGLRGQPRPPARH